MAVNFEVDGHTAVVSIDRPERRNAVDAATAADLVRVFDQFDKDPDLSVAILRGRKGNFCAGADLKALSDGELPSLSPLGHGPMGPTRTVLSKPVIAAVEGYAVAGGMELALWCDLRVVAQGAVFGIFCRRFGVPLVDLGTIRLPRLIGQSRALDLILTGRPVEADEAFEMGLANRLVSTGNALEAALQLAREIASFPQICLRNDRASVLGQWELSDQDALAFEVQRGQQTLASGETLAGASGFARGKGRHGKFSRDSGGD